MNEANLEQFVKLLREQMNLVFAMALDETIEFTAVETRLRELVGILEACQSGDIAAEQLFNFAQIAYYRKRYPDAFAYTAEAMEMHSVKGPQMGEKCRNMALALLEETLRGDSDQALLDLAAAHLSPADYAGALAKAAAAPDFCRKLAMEALRQGIGKEKTDPAAALEFLKAAQPHLNPKRAAAVQGAIAQMEWRIHGQK